MTKIGLIDVDSHNSPNYALMKISAYYKSLGHEVEWAAPLFGNSYDVVYKSKIFTFTPDDEFFYPCEVIKGGTGYDIKSKLEQAIDDMAPDYSIYPEVDSKTAYGFLTRGCPNKCAWCCVPIKEGKITPYRDVEDISEGGRRTNLILMDNNVLASDFGLAQIEKIVEKRYRVDFNQALDARLVTDDIAQLLAKVRYISQIRFGCDTPKQIVECEKAMQLIDKYRKKPASYLMYTMIDKDMNEAYTRLSHFRDNKRVRIVAQPFRDFNNPKQIIPQWQKDMARWAMRREIYASCDFKDYEPRHGFKCNSYFEQI